MTLYITHVITENVSNVVKDTGEIISVSSNGEDNKEMEPLRNVSVASQN